jgi:hypothetical protein
MVLMILDLIKRASANARCPKDCHGILPSAPGVRLQVYVYDAGLFR